MRLLKQSSTAQPLVFLMIGSSDHISPKTGLTPTVLLSKNGGSFASPSGSVTEIGNGWYKVAGNATDTGTLGPLVLHATATGADPCDMMFEVVAFDPQSATNLGLSGLPTANPAASGGLPTVDANNNIHGVQPGTGTGQLNPSSGKVPVTLATADVSGNLPANVLQINGHAVAATGSTTFPTGTLALTGDKMDLVDAPNATAVSAIQNGLATGAGITSLQSHGDATWATATGFALASVWTSSLANTIATHLDATVSSRLAASSYAASPTTAQIATAVWTDTTGGDFTTNGSPGKLLLATGVTVATNNDKTGYALASAGLDAIATTEPSGTVNDWNFRQRLLALFGRFFNKATAPDSGNGTLTLYQRDGATHMSAQTVVDNGTTQTQGGA